MFLEVCKILIRTVLNSKVKSSTWSWVSLSCATSLPFCGVDSRRHLMLAGILYAGMAGFMSAC